jgi:hypothetical protein
LVEVERQVCRSIANDATNKIELVESLGQRSCAYASSRCTQPRQATLLAMNLGG